MDEWAGWFTSVQFALIQIELKLRRPNDTIIPENLRHGRVEM